MPKMIGRMASSKPAAKAAAKPGYAMDPASVLARAERVQAAEAGESRLARAKPANKPATPTMSAAARAATQATLDRAARVQREEAGESAMLRRKPAQPVVKTTVSYRPTPTKKGK